MVSLQIGDRFETTMLCTEHGGGIGVDYVWNTAYATLTVFHHQSVCLHATTLAVWADTPISVQAKGSLSLSQMQFTKAITVESGGILDANKLLFVNMLDTALDIDGAAYLTNCSFNRGTASAITLGGSMCTPPGTNTIPELCPNSATLSVLGSTFTGNGPSHGRAITVSGVPLQSTPDRAGIRAKAPSSSSATQNSRTTSENLANPHLHLHLRARVRLHHHQLHRRLRT